jgi:hypothetical protein
LDCVPDRGGFRRQLRDDVISHGWVAALSRHMLISTAARPYERRVPSRGQQRHITRFADYLPLNRAVDG